IRASLALVTRKSASANAAALRTREELVCSSIFIALAARASLEVRWLFRLRNSVTKPASSDADKAVKGPFACRECLIAGDPFTLRLADHGLPNHHMRAGRPDGRR